MLRDPFHPASELIQVNESHPGLCHQGSSCGGTMFKYILVPATGARTDAPVFATALALARLFPAHLEFLHVRIDVQQTVMAMASADMGGGGGYDQIIQSLEQEVANRQRLAEQAFREFCEQEHLPVSGEPTVNLPSAEWGLETGDEPILLAEHGRTADLLVVGRAREGEAVALDILEAALMGTGRPVLIAPPIVPRSISGTVAVAWKDTPESAKAVAAAQPFLAIADQVVIYTVDEGTEHDEFSCERLRHELSWHNTNISLHHLKQDDRPPVEVLMNAVARANADLLVMGGYGHSRLREVIFGGFTRHVLNGARLPVLMAH
jgi:nucleotide-binding universal stress UspA family protein